MLIDASVLALLVCIFSDRGSFHPLLKSATPFGLNLGWRPPERRLALSRSEVLDIYCMRMCFKGSTHKFLMQPARMCFMVTCSSRGTPSVHHRIPFNRISYLPSTDCRHIYGVRVQRDVELTLKIGSVYHFLCCFPPFNDSLGLKKT